MRLTRLLPSLRGSWSTHRRRKGPIAMISPATKDEADCLEAALKSAFLVRRVGSQIYVNEAPGHDAPFNALLDALEDCLADNGLARIQLTVDGHRYVMFARDDA